MPYSVLSLAMSLFFQKSDQFLFMYLHPMHVRSSLLHKLGLMLRNKAGAIPDKRRSRARREKSLSSGAQEGFWGRRRVIEP
jgi:hypothetical protein